MRAYNVTGRHLTGADRRRLARLNCADRRRHRALLVASYGTEKGLALAATIARRNERELLSLDEGRPTGAAVVMIDHGGDKIPLARLNRLRDLLNR